MKGVDFGGWEGGILIGEEVVIEVNGKGIYSANSKSDKEILKIRNEGVNAFT